MAYFCQNICGNIRSLGIVASRYAVEHCNYGAAQRISGHAHYGRIALEVCNEAVAYCVKVDTPYYQHQHHAQHTESLYAEAGYAAAAESYLYRFPY